MSSVEGLAAEVCASCGKAEIDDIKLKKCTACKLVKYCSVECQKNHRKQHKKACKKRAAELSIRCNKIIMSSTAETAEADTCCANCGAAEIDDIKLEDCGGCDLVKYCSDNCKEGHREQHEEECNKRKAALHDRKLFTQPNETHHGECPLCFLPLPIDLAKSMFWTCCSEIICNGCIYANVISNNGGGHRCPFCREPAPGDEEERQKRIMKRVKANDPAAMRQMGVKCCKEGDYGAAFEYWTKAAGLGNIDVHLELACFYKDGEGVEKDEGKEVYHYEKAAIAGHAIARHNLAIIELRKGNIERSVKHLIIAANLGNEDSMKNLWKYYSVGHITKEDLDATLRTHQAAIDGMKSAQRDAAEVAFAKYES